MDDKIAEDLIPELESLRGLARSLVSDRHLAEDLVQETWLQARVSPPKGPGSLKNWAAVVLRNLVRQDRRGAERRRQRERAGAREEPQVDAAEQAARLELCHQVIAAVEALEEPYRSPVYLRYFEHKNATEIGRQLGLPAATVRTRLRRGIEMLRSRLDRTHAGNRRAWSLVLTPLAFPKGEAIAAVATTTSVPGVLLMTSKSIPFVLLAVAILGGAWLSGVFTTDPLLDLPAGTPGGPAAGTTGPGEPGGERVDEAGATRALVTTSGPSEAGRYSYGIDVRVLDDETGLPVKEVPLGIRGCLGTSGDGETLFEIEGWTSSTGEFRMWRERFDGTTTVRVRSLDERWSIDEQQVRFTRERLGMVSLRVAATRLDVEVGGRVTDARGRGLAVAELQYGIRPPIRCDEAGRYKFYVRRNHRWPLVLRAWAPGHATTRTEIVLEQDRIERDIVLRPGLLLRGRVLDADGKPVEDAEIRVGSQWTPTTHSGVDGGFRTWRLDPDVLTYHVSARHRDHVRGHLEIRRTELLRDPDRVWDIRMRRGLRVSGRVVDDNGKPVEAASIFLAPESLNNESEDAVTDAQGRFEFPAARGWWKLFWVRARGFGLTAVPYDWPTPRGPREGIVVRLLPGRRLQLQVTDPGGRPLPGAAVFADVVLPDSEMRALGNEVDLSLGFLGRTDAQGSFSSEGMPRQTFSVTALKEGYQRATVTTASGDPVQVKVGLGHMTGFAGKVVDANTGEPIRDFRVRFVPPRLEAGETALTSWRAIWSQGRVFSSETGEFDSRQQAMPLDRWIGLEVSAEGYAPLSDLHVCGSRQPKPTDHVFRLLPGAQIKGVVRDLETGRPIAGAWVVASTHELGSRILTPLGKSYPGRWTRTDAMGLYHLRDLPWGRFEIGVQQPGYAPRIERGLQLTGAKITKFDPILARGASVHGSIRGFPQGVTLVLRAEDLPGFAPRDLRRTDLPGSAFDFGGLLPGHYSLRIVGDKAVVLQRWELDLTDKERRRLDLLENR